MRVDSVHITTCIQPTTPPGPPLAANAAIRRTLWPGPPRDRPHASPAPLARATPRSVARALARATPRKWPGLSPLLTSLVPVFELETVPLANLRPAEVNGVIYKPVRDDDPAVLKLSQRLRDAINSVIDVDVFNGQVEQEKQDSRTLAAYKKTAIDYLKRMGVGS